MSDEIPTLAPGVDITKLPISVDEAMILTRVDGRTRVDELATLLARPAAQVAKTIGRLAAMGVLTLKTAPKPTSLRSNPPDARAASSPSKPASVAAKLTPAPSIGARAAEPAKGADAAKPPAKISDPAKAPEASKASDPAKAAPASKASDPAKPPETSKAASERPTSSGRPSLPERRASGPTPPAAPAGPKVPSGDGPHDFGNHVFAPAHLLEETDLDLELRKKILFTDEHLSVWTHYELLAIDRKCEAKAIKQGYFERSKEWHPDRFRRFKQPASFGKRIEAIYKRINQAYKVLGDPETRAQYDATLPKVVDASDIESILREQIEAERAQRREEEAKERRLKRNPVMARFGKAKELYDQAIALEKDGKLDEALRAAHLATTFDDRKAEIVALHERLKNEIAERKSAVYARRGGEAEKDRDWEVAIVAYQNAIQQTPTKGELHLRFAYSLLQAGRPVDEVMPHAHRALTLVPSDAESHYVIARCYEERGNEKGAQRHYAKALELKPGFEEAEKRIKKSRWGF